MLMTLFMNVLDNQVKRMHANNVRLQIIGDRSAFSEKLQARIAASESLTANNTGLKLMVAANYGGRWDITQAAIRLARDVANGHVNENDIDEKDFSHYLSLAGLPEPDLFIRTGGEERISNFLLWQLAYTELYFTDLLWPDFNPDELDKAIDSFSKRQRRYGRTSQQVTDN